MKSGCFGGIVDFMKRLFIFGAAALLFGCAESADLFNKDLSNAECKKPVWSFGEDGALGSTVDEILWTKDDYENFELELEYKVTPEGNGGIIVYSTNTDNWIPDSIEVQIGDYDYWLEKFGPNGTDGAIFGFQGVKKRFSKPLGEWNTLRMVCRGKSIKVYINGELANDFDMTKFTDSKKNPDGTVPFKWLQNTPRSEVATKGRIGFQGHHGKGDAFYRNLKIKKLD